MADPIIRVENLGKRYELAHQVRHDTLRDSLAHGFRALVRRWSGAEARTAREEFWALRDVSFEVNRGDVVGIIGRNGAGKSTLLKILSRITEPSTGRVRLRGRVASLLEVGTGFHPELTGRENIFLNGAILGMTRAEISRKFDEIVAFAEVERFLDTPVKHYSSGMYVRLAFAVAAHLEPEILIVDEVLAVGDAQFQSKCLGKMESVSRHEGRTVLLVSHNMSIIQSLCTQALHLVDGHLRFQGAPGAAVEQYLARGGAQSFARDLPDDRRCGITSGAVSLVASADGPWVEVESRLASRVNLRAAFEVRLHDAQGQALAFGSLGTFDPARMVELAPGETAVRCRFHAGGLANGRYVVTLKLVRPFAEVYDEASHALAFDLASPPLPGESHRLLQEWGCGAHLLALERLA